MCDVVTPAMMMYIAMASTAASVVSQQQAASAQEDTNAQNTNNLKLAAGNNANQINLARVQATDAAGQKINANNQDLRQAQATSIARAGPSGLSVDALLADMGRKGATYNESVNANLDRTNLQLDSQLANVNSSTASAINSQKTPAMPDYLGAALKIGSAYVGSGAYQGGGSSPSHGAVLDSFYRGTRGSGD